MAADDGGGGGGALGSKWVALIIALLVVVVVVVVVLVILIRRGSKNASRDGDREQSFRSCSCTKNLENTQISRLIFSDSGIEGFSPDMRNFVLAKQKRGQVFTYKELEVATGGFGEANVIGRGGFGVVFKGTLTDGTKAAIKVLHREGRHGEREFRLEVDLLSRLQSYYLIGLLGYCADQHHRLLVFEFMPNGSLRDYLHPAITSGSAAEKRRHPPPPVLSWYARMRIALDCARGLEFLHEHFTPPVIHRDFNSSNVLLDGSLRAKVSDFGIARAGSSRVNGHVLTRVLGTTGYVAPEYASTGKLTTKSDVYSYGVVLLELLTGRVPIDIKRPPGEHVLVSWALRRLTNREKVQEMVDPALQGQHTQKDLIQVAAIAAMCVQSEADYRPLMTDVVQSLIPLVKIQMASPAPPPPPPPRETSLFRLP